MNLTKNMKGPFKYSVIGSSVSVTRQGKTVTGTYDGKGRIIWPTNKYLPNGSTWTKIGMIIFLLEIRLPKYIIQY